MAQQNSRSQKLREGYYLELKNANSETKSGIKIRRETYAEIQQALRRYKNSHSVQYLGKLTNGKFVKSES